MFGKRLKLAFAAGLTGVICWSVTAPVLAAAVNIDLVYDGASHTYAAEEVNLTVDGTAVTGLDMPPVILEDRTLAPLRAIAERLGAEVTWNDDTKQAYLIKNSDVVVVQIDNLSGTRNGETFTMDVAPKIINDRTMMPVRAVAEALGCNVGWVADTRTVVVTSTAQATTPSTSSQNTTTSEQPAADNTSAASEINVTGVTLPAISDVTQVFTIQTSGTIEKYESLLVGTDRLAVDVYNANFKMSGSVSVSDSPVVSAIRAAQNQVTPTKITRIVFDMLGCPGYTVTLSSDKKSILVRFDNNQVKNLEVATQSNIETVTIDTKDQPAATVSYLTNPNRVVVDIANAKSSLDESYSVNGSSLIQGIRTSQYAANTVRVVLELAENVDYQEVVNSKGIAIQVYKSALKNISYDSNSRVLTLKKTSDLDIDRIIHSDDYLDLTYTMTLPGDYESDFGYGIIRVQDSYLNQIAVENNSSGETVLTFRESQIMAYTVSEDAENIYISVQKPKEKYSKIVVIDAGHGDSDPGASGNGLIEKAVNLAILNKVMALFEANDNVKAYATRLDDSYPQNAARAQMGNDLADVFVSIHQNSTAGATTASGIETYYTPHSNEQSGKLTSKLAATIMQQYLVRATGAVDRNARNDSALIVLNQSTTNAMLVECGFLTNSDEAVKLGTDSYQQIIAQAIYSALVDMLSQYSTR